MKGVFYKISERKVVVEDVPPPKFKKGGVLIKTLYSAISPGTEGATVSLVKGGPLKILKERKEQVLDILRVFKDYGPIFLINKIRSRAEMLTPLGYSLCGEVIEGWGDIKKGELVVAVGGEFANHCEIVWVPENLVVKANRRDKAKELSFGALISIAVHSIRRSGISGGERALVIGMGIIGHLIARILRVWDVEVWGMDKDDYRLKFAEGYGINVVSGKPPEDYFDVAFITAPDKSGEVVNIAGKSLRDRGRVVAVADANFSFDWKTYYYKELEILVSRSYGPGRYDPEYEVGGRDYPIGYVRWTEKRNLEYAVKLVESERLKIEDLITHEFPIDKAPDAYDLITHKRDKFLGIVIKYPSTEIPQKRVYISKGIRKERGKIGVGFVGAGSYAQGFLIPEVKGLKDVQLIGVATSKGNTAKSISQIFGFPVYTTDYKELLKMEEVDVIFIATTHSTHAKITLEALKMGKAVFVEKPLAITMEELSEIESFLSEKGGYLTVGFNRRFSPHTRFLKSFLNHPFQLNYLVDAGMIKKEHWIYREGGRVLGEAIHFVDYAIFLSDGKEPVVHISNSGDGAVIVLAWGDSVATITYGTFGGKMRKEEITLMCSGKTVRIEDFRVSYTDKEKFKTPFIDKGQRELIRAFFEGLESGKPPIPYEQIFLSHKVLIPHSSQNHIL
ncbi:MAG: bi-domain-containing oxidoreductase [candidate division WOR-3 bacterium]